MLGQGSVENLGVLGMAVLAVVGGAVAGAALTAVLVWLTCRTFFRKQPTPSVAKVLRYLGAIAGALAVGGFLKFGGGTGYLFGTGGPGGGVANSTEAGDKKPATKSGEEKPAKLDSPPAKREDRVRVTVLGGTLVKGKAYYRLDGSPEAVDLARVKEAVRARQAAGPLAGVDILIYQNSLGYNTDPVRQLKVWVTESGLTPNPAELPGDIPP
jgi:hypothetical protein